MKVKLDDYYKSVGNCCVNCKYCTLYFDKFENFKIKCDSDAFEIKCDKDGERIFLPSVPYDCAYFEMDETVLKH